jgi:hypothetical protein
MDTIRSGVGAVGDFLETTIETGERIFVRDPAPTPEGAPAPSDADTQPTLADRVLPIFANFQQFRENIGTVGETGQVPKIAPEQVSETRPAAFTTSIGTQDLVLLGIVGAVLVFAIVRS